jgi:hypothetical protein
MLIKRSNGKCEWVVFIYVVHYQSYILQHFPVNYIIWTQHKRYNTHFNLFDSLVRSQPHTTKWLLRHWRTDSKPNNWVQNTFVRTLPSWCRYTARSRLCNKFRNQKLEDICTSIFMWMRGPSTWKTDRFTTGSNQHSLTFLVNSSSWH